VIAGVFFAVGLAVIAGVSWVIETKRDRKTATSWNEALDKVRDSL
jgi:hypothetical protein